MSEYSCALFDVNSTQDINGYLLDFENLKILAIHSCLIGDIEIKVRSKGDAVFLSKETVLDYATFD